MSNLTTGLVFFAIYMVGLVSMGVMTKKYDQIKNDDIFSLYLIVSSFLLTPFAMVVTLAIMFP
jgi:hypothetical protein